MSWSFLPCFLIIRSKTLRVVLTTAPGIFKADENYLVPPLRGSRPFCRLPSPYGLGYARMRSLPRLRRWFLGTEGGLVGVANLNVSPLRARDHFDAYPALTGWATLACARCRASGAGLTIDKVSRRRCQAFVENLFAPAALDLRRTEFSLRRCQRSWRICSCIQHHRLKSAAKGRGAQLKTWACESFRSRLRPSGRKIYMPCSSAEGP